MPFPTFEATSPVFTRHLAARYGERELIVLDDRRLTYAEADAQSAALAKGMLTAGIGKGTRVGLLLPNGPDFLLTWLAATRIGSLVIPINTFYKPPELGQALKHADVQILLTIPRLLNNNYIERLEAFSPSLKRAAAPTLYLAELPYLRSIYILGEHDRPWALPYERLRTHCNPAVDDRFLEAVEASVAPADPMTIIYSSGSASEPKGIIHTHGTVIRHSFNLGSFGGVQADDRCYSPMPFFWVGGLIFTLYRAMHQGACLITEAAFNPEDTLELLERERVTCVTGWPHYGKAMIEHPTFKDRDLSSIRAGNIYALLPEHLQPKDLELRSNSLGMTETCGPHSLDRMDMELPELLRGSFGRPLEGLEIKIVDPNNGASLPPGQIGELCLRGYSLMQGLYKIEREDTFDADGFYHTQDVCYLNQQGYLFFKGRLGEMIKTGGANVIPREIEVLLEAQPEIQAAFVVGIPDPERGQIVAAAIVLKDGCSVDEDAILERLKSDLSSYKLPKHVVFRRLNDLPFTDSGKIDKRRLSAQLAAHQHGRYAHVIRDKS